MICWVLKFLLAVFWVVYCWCFCFDLQKVTVGSVRFGFLFFAWGRGEVPVWKSLELEITHQPQNKAKICSSLEKLKIVESRECFSLRCFNESSLF